MTQHSVLGAILAGGASRRFGSDKALALLDERPLIAHVLERLEPQCDGVVVCGREWAGVRSIPDRPAAGLGPLGGLCAALTHGRAAGFDLVMAVPCDVPDLPLDIVARLRAAGAPVVVEALPVVALWPCDLADLVDDHLEAQSDRSLRHLVRSLGARAIVLDPPLSNINRPGDLAAIG